MAWANAFVNESPTSSDGVKWTKGDALRPPVVGGRATFPETSGFP
jgi:hypothetical protein